MTHPARALDRLLEESRDGILLGDLEGRITYGNRTAARLLGRTSGELASLTLADLAASATRSDGTPFPGGRADFDLRIAEGEELDGEEFAFDRGASGKVVLSISARPLLDGSGKLVGSASRLVDLTDRRRLEAELHRADHLHSLGNYVGRIANDFNNILTAILGNVSLARLDATTNEEVQRTLTYVERAAIRARELATQLLELAGAEQPRRKPALVESLVRDAAKTALRRVPIRVDYRIGPEPLTADIDRDALGRALRSVLGTIARTAREGGRITIEIREADVAPEEVAGLDRGRYVRISVADDEFRASSESLQRVLSLAFAGEDTAGGLGLTAARAVVAEHGGAITLQAGDESGLACHVFLPWSPPAPAEVSDLPAEPVRGTGRILVMDDQEMVRQVAARMLRYLGYEPDSAPDGESAIRMYLEARDAGRPFDAVILDLEVPGGMGGAEAAGRLREADPGVRALLSTGYTNDPVAHSLQEHGFVGSVRKPYEIVRLSVTLDQALGGKG